ncbi:MULTISPECIES: Gfo/Idh/MocA family protein [Niastella]|uniref:Gfo/Idh/MocA family oxidoreductase n=1 Tax=Niastella soli TaxID=2821487 RepID=A0ABS3YZI5_9BACT|nr:Gfo/Idh/MocA family oxidoreductase [Niastella soli]MBO9203298.1 Gfo/Idh/MocA family oxidoreductase [Niastella soli]
MPFTSWIDKYKALRKQSYLNAINRYRLQYAFIGVGSHSISNLYPCLQNLHVPLRYIYSRHVDHAQKLAVRFSGATGTDRLSDIMEDPAIKGIFICSHPSQHFWLLQQALQAGKHVFIEKPVCYSLAELQSLVPLQKDNVCVVGLQRRSSTITRLLNKHGLLKDASSYTYRYCTGPYPEGNVLIELFIHPIDNLVQLFGVVQSLQVQKKTGNGVTYQLLVQHTNGVQGMVELSTQYSWNDALETMEVNGARGLVQIQYPNGLSVWEKPMRILGMPAEKIMQRPTIQKVYLNNRDFIPAEANNSLVVQGFYPEIKHFLHLVENNKKDERGQLSSLVNTYELLEQLKKW